MDNMLFEETISLMLDGNALAGLLHELFDVEMTIAPVECVACGRSLKARDTSCAARPARISSCG